MGTELGTRLRAMRLGYRWSQKHGAYFRISERGKLFRVDICPKDIFIPNDNMEFLCWWEAGDDVLDEYPILRKVKNPKEFHTVVIDSVGNKVKSSGEIFSEECYQAEKSEDNVVPSAHILYDDEGIPTDIDWQLQGSIQVGDKFIWEPLSPYAREEITIVSIHKDMKLSIKSITKNGRTFFNDEDVFRESCVRDYRGDQR